MKKFYTSLLAILIVVVGVLGVPPVVVHAVDVISPVCDNRPPDSPTGTPSVCKDNNASNSNPNSNPLFGPKGLLTTYIHILALVIALASVLMIILAGLRFITSQGDPEGISRARNSVLYAVVGLVVAATAQVLVTFVLARLK